MESKEFTLPYWLDEATEVFHAKDCPTCGGSGELRDGNPGCGECHGSGVVPGDDCPEDVAKLIRDDNQRRVFNADEDWNHDPEGDDEDVYGEGSDGRAHPVEPDDNEEYCPACGGSGGDGYDSDYGVCGTCHGSGCVAKGWDEGDEEE